MRELEACCLTERTGNCLSHVSCVVSNVTNATDHLALEPEAQELPWMPYTLPPTSSETPSLPVRLQTTFAIHLHSPPLHHLCPGQELPLPMPTPHPCNEHRMPAACYVPGTGPQQQTQEMSLPHGSSVLGGETDSNAIKIQSLSDGGKCQRETAWGGDRKWQGRVSVRKGSPRR